MKLTEKLKKINIGKTDAVVIGALIVGGVAGIAITKVANLNGPGTDFEQTTNTPASDLRANSVSFAIKHTALVNKATAGIIDGSKDVDASKAAAYNSIAEISSAYGSINGKEDEAKFNDAWKTYLDQIFIYADASKRGDASAKQAALDAIAIGYTKPQEEYFAKAGVPESVLKTAFADYVYMMTKIVDNHAAGKYTEETAVIGEANGHLEGVFSMLAESIVNKSPEQSKN